LTTNGGIGETTAAMRIAELGDPARFASAAALTAYVGLCPGHKHSGSINRKVLRSARSAIGGYGGRYGCRISAPRLKAIHG
jgi:transposase